MMRSHLFTRAAIPLSIVLSAAGAAPSQRPLALDAIQVGAHVYFPDGRTASTWRFSTNGRIAGEISTVDTLCAFNVPPRDSGGYGWHFDVTPIRFVRDGDRPVATVRVEWSRVRHGGQPTDAPRGTVELTVTPGKPIPLDYMVPAPLPEGRTCSAIGMLLDVSMRSER